MPTDEGAALKPAVPSVTPRAVQHNCEISVRSTGSSAYMRRERLRATASSTERPPSLFGSGSPINSPDIDSPILLPAGSRILKKPMTVPTTDAPIPAKIKRNLLLDKGLTIDGLQSQYNRIVLKNVHLRHEAQNNHL